MKLFELFATIKLDDKEFTDGVKRSTAAGRQLGSSMEGVSIKAVALGTALYNAGVQAAKMAGSFIKTSIEAAAQVQAETAQFNSAFGEMAGIATKALKNVEGETGILYTRLRTVGTKAFSQLKGAGLETADAMAAMEEYTSLAADAAAYYDISLEEADAKLRSFMRGNTEAGDAIGLFTSEAQRNERAVEKYGQKWQDLSEAQKQLLMLDITREIYTQSGAIGQAAKEAGSWSNIIGNLGSAWTNAIAKFGAPIQAAVTPAVQGIIDFLNSEDTKTKLEQAGLLLADGFTALYDGEGSPVQNVIDLIGDIAGALSSDTGTSVLNAVGLVAGAIWTLSSPLHAVIALVATIATNWDTVKRSASNAWAAITGNNTKPPEYTAMDWSELSVTQKNNAIAAGIVSPELASQYEEILNPKGGTIAGGGDRRALAEDDDYGVFGGRYVPSGSKEYSFDSTVAGFAKGLPYVPYDNYLARLHRGEQVVQANRATQNRNGGMDASALYGAILAAVRDGVSNIGVSMDGQRVGKIVSRHQAAQIDNDIRAGRYSYA